MNEIQVHHDASVTTLTIHREQSGNMFDLPMIHEMTRQLGLAGSQGHCVVIRGSGPNFCRGRDPSTAGPQPSPIDLRDRVLSPIMGLYDAIRFCPLPVIAAVQGDALGLGCAIAGSDSSSAMTAPNKSGSPKLFLPALIHQKCKIASMAIG